MTTAQAPSTRETVEFSTEDQTLFLTGAEIAEIEDDPLLTVAEVVEYRTDAEPDVPEYDCTRCEQSTADPRRICPDCFHEQRGERR